MAEEGPGEPSSAKPPRSRNRKRGGDKSNLPLNATGCVAARRAETLACSCTSLRWSRLTRMGWHLRRKNAGGSTVFRHPVEQDSICRIIGRNGTPGKPNSCASTRNVRASAGRFRQKTFYFENGSRGEVFLSNCRRLAGPANCSNRGEFGPIFAHAPPRTDPAAETQPWLFLDSLTLDPFPGRCPSPACRAPSHPVSLRLHQPDIPILDLVSMGL